MVIRLAYASVWAWISYDPLLYSLLISLFLSFCAINNCSLLNTVCSLPASTLVWSLYCFSWEASHYFVLTTQGHFFQCSFHRIYMHVKLFTYFPLRTYNQHLTGKNNLLLILLLQSLYLFTVQRGTVLFHLTEELKRSLKYMLLGLLSLSRQKASI